MFMLIFYAFSFVVTFNSKWASKNIYQNLHPLDYTTTISDLSFNSIRTPALPMRLASTWEIQNALNMPSDPLISTYNLIYPLMENTNDMDRLLSEKTTTPNKRHCAACEAQKVFKFKNVLRESQKQQYCPKRGERETEWLSRTGYTKQTDDQNSKFNFNSEHAEFCRKTRLPSMALAHVAVNTFTLFSSQNTAILLLYVATVNIVFSFSIAIYKAWGMHLQNDFSLHKKLQIGSYYSGLFLVMSFISLIPAIIDFAERGDGKLPDNRSLGSFVLGLWTVLFSFVYVYVIPRMNVRLSQSNTEEQGVSERTQKDPLIIKYFVSHQPMISLAYWNFMQLPCIVLAVITRNSYGIDVYMQFIVFGAIAIGVLDIIHTRVNMIIGLTRRIKAKIHSTGDSTSLDDKVVSSTYNDFFVNCAFFGMNLVISIPIFIKLAEANVHIFGYVATGFVLYSHLIQNALVLIYRYTRRCCKMEKISNGKGPYEDTTDWAFEWSLIWQMLVSLIAFFLVLGMQLVTV